MIKFYPNPYKAFSYTKHKKSVYSNFLNRSVIARIGTKLEDFSNLLHTRFLKPDLSLSDVEELCEKNRNFLTAITFILENFEKRTDVLILIRKPRPIFVHASLLYIEKLLTKTDSSLARIKKYVENDGKTVLGIPSKPSGIKLQKLKDEITQSIHLITGSLKELDKEYEISGIFKKDLIEYSLNRKDIQVGDVILWYKNKNYLKQDFYSKLISIAEHSNITHTSIVSHILGNHIEHINPDNLNENLEIHNENLEIPKNVILFIMRPVLGEDQKKIFLSELESLKEDIVSKRKIFRFPTFKIWYAGIIGYIYMNLIKYFHSIFIMKNIFKQKNTIYCGELIDILFKKVGIFLVPRSEYDSIIGPSELLYSPYLKFMGILFNPDEEKLVHSEKYNI